MSRTTWNASVLALVLCASACAADTDDVDVAAVEEALGHYGHGGDPLIRQDHPIGKWLYKELAKGWLRWMMGQPFSTGPVADTTGASCGFDQHGPVFFLAGTTGGHAVRDCEIPRHKVLYFPLINRWMIPPDELADEPAEMAEYLEFAHSYFPERRELTCSLTLTLDGEEVLADTAERDEELYTEIYDPFSVFLDPDNYYGDGVGGPYSYALTSGHYALLKPLSRGRHTLELGGMICNGEEIEFETSVLYNLDVR
jgi:hypothetical protein